MGDAAGAWPASPPSTTGGQPDEETAIIDRSGVVTERLPVPEWMVAVSPDERHIAWATDGGLHVYDRSTHAERVYSQPTAVTATVVWSPDSAEIGYLRFTGYDAVRVWVVDIALGVERRVYSAEPDTRVQHLAFTAADRLQFDIAPLSSVAAQYDLPGARYVVADDGSGGRFLDDPATLWSDCGSPCGMPPAGYEGVDGLARWCERSPGGGACTFHLAFVDRVAGVVRELAAGDFAAWSFSPDRRQVAILLSTDTDQVLRVVRLDDFTSSDSPLGFTYANNVAWFPDGRSLLLWTSGGN